MPDRQFLALLALILMAMAGWVSAAQQNRLPAGFAGINLGDTWDSVDNGRALQDLNTVTSAWERSVSECGYRSALLDTGKGRILITANNFKVTALSFSAAIKPGSNLMAVANQIIKQYGQPKQATLRDALGKVTIDPSRVQHVLLHYKSVLRADFSVSGAPLWEYRISINDKDEHRLENAMLRCARKLSSGKSKKSTNNNAG